MNNFPAFFESFDQFWVSFSKVSLVSSFQSVESFCLVFFLELGHRLTHTCQGFSAFCKVHVQGVVFAFTWIIRNVVICVDKIVENVAAHERKLCRVEILRPKIVEPFSVLLSVMIGFQVCANVAQLDEQLLPKFRSPG